MNGKGSRNRTTDHRAFRENYDKVFRNSKRTPKLTQTQIKTLMSMGVPDDFFVSTRPVKLRHPPDDGPLPDNWDWVSRRLERPTTKQIEAMANALEEYFLPKSNDHSTMPHMPVLETVR